MIKKPIDNIKDKDLREHIEFLQEEVQGNPLSLSATPTESAPLLEDNEEGIYSDVLYKRVGNTIYVFTPSSTISIS